MIYLSWFRGIDNDQILSQIQETPDTNTISLYTVQRWIDDFVDEKH
jgi:hypothetical protein